MIKKINIKVIPGSSKNQVIGYLADGTLKVKLTAPPVQGKANKQLLALLSEYFDVKTKKIKIVRGTTNTQKIVEIEEV